MKQSIFEVEQNREIAPKVFELILQGDTSEITQPGQFVQISLPDFFLRRPISVCDVDGTRLTLLYKVIGHGTLEMSQLSSGARLDLLTGLGNGYPLSECGKQPLLIGGGIGTAPMYLLAKRLLAAGAQVRAILGFNTKEEIFYEEKFKALGVNTIVTTTDGSYGIAGFVTDAMQMPYTYVYACGPSPMLKAVYETSETSGAFSFEARMGCGFGACMGCSCKTKFGNKRICKDGPVFKKEEILW